MPSLPLVWRGEHGPERLATRLATLTFVDNRAAAEVYAREPNDRSQSAQALQPTLIQAELTLARPIFDDPDDPFLDYTILAQRVGPETAQAIFLRHADWVTGTNAWEEVAEQGYSDVSDVVVRAPHLLHDLCVQIWPLLDDPTTVDEFRSAGFDGAIHASSGATLDAVEYRVFDPAQVRIVVVEALDPPALTPPAPAVARRRRR